MSVRSAPEIFQAVTKFRGKVILQRADVFAGKKVNSNAVRILMGLAPEVGEQAVHLHHVGQRVDGPLIEVLAAQNRAKGPLHIPGVPGVHKQLDPKEWNEYRQSYWLARLKQAVHDGFVSKDYFDRVVKDLSDKGSIPKTIREGL